MIACRANPRCQMLLASSPRLSKIIWRSPDMAAMPRSPLFRPVTNNHTGDLERPLDAASVLKYGAEAGISADVNGHCVPPLLPPPPPTTRPTSPESRNRSVSAEPIRVFKQSGGRFGWPNRFALSPPLRRKRTRLRCVPPYCQGETGALAVPLPLCCGRGEVRVTQAPREGPFKCAF